MLRKTGYRVDKRVLGELNYKCNLNFSNLLVVYTGATFALLIIYLIFFQKLH